MRRQKIVKTLVVMLLVLLTIIYAVTPAFAISNESLMSLTEKEASDTEQEVENPREVDYYKSDYSCEIKLGSSSSYIKTKLYSILTSEVSASSGHTVTDVLMTSNIPQNITEDGTIDFKVTYEDKNYEVIKVNYTVISPESYEFANDLKDISADSNYNTNFNNLINYVNSDLTLNAIGEEYNNALGDAVATAPKFTAKNCTDTYNPYGDTTYTFIQIYNGVTLVREFTVNSVSKSTPKVTINYSTNTLNGTDSQMVYSLDNNKWSACSSNMSIPSNMMGYTVYFKYQATNYYPESGTYSLYVPDEAESPDEKLELSSTSKTITILNCDDFDDCEFSINGSSWVSTSNDTYTFRGLRSGTSYKVYVRVEADPGYNLASSSKSYSIKTLSSDDIGVDVTTEKQNTTGYVYGDIDVESDISNKILNSTINNDLIKEFYETVEDYIDSYRTVYSTLIISQFSEDTHNGVKLSLPLSGLKETINDSNFNIKYYSDILNVDIDGDNIPSTSYTMKLEFSKLTSAPTSSKLSWVKSQYNDGRPVYRVNTEVGSKDLTVNYTIPYTLESGETVSELNVYAVDLDGSKRNINVQYNVYTGAFEFQSNLDGYIVISDDGYYNYMPFYDVSPYHWAYSYIKSCYNSGWMNGVSTNVFSPETNITRGMIFTILERMSGTTGTVVSKSKFTDVSLDDWYSDAAHWALENKLISGKEFNANSAMTRAEIADVLYNYMDMLDYNVNITITDNIPYTDISKLKTDEIKAISYLNDLGIMVGTSKTKFSPNSNVTRAQMATIICRLDNIIN